MSQLPFDKLDVYHSFKFALEELAEEEGEVEAERDSSGKMVSAIIAHNSY